MKNVMKTVSLATIILGLLFGMMSVSYAMDTTAKQAVMIDVNTQMVLMDKNAHEQMPTSSMSKTMTLYMVFEALKQGRIHLDDTFHISEKAWRMGGSKMFIKVGDDVTVEDLIRGVAIQSGNDAAVALAEGLGGTEDAFVEMLNVRAKELGMNNTHLANASGWPHPEHYSTAHDLAILAYHLIKDFPEYYHYFAETEFTYNGIRQSNRNPLLSMNIGADGIKTGHTEIAGYGLMASAERNGRRLILVVNGLDSAKVRGQEPARLFAWGFSNFESKTLFKANDVVGNASVWMGTSSEIPMVVGDDVTTLIERINRDKLDVTVRYKEPVQAPVAVGDEVGTLVVKMGDFPEKTYPLYAGADVAELGVVAKIMAKGKYLLSMSE